MQHLLRTVLAGQDLTSDQASGVVYQLASGRIDPALAGAMLVALRAKGESGAEIRGFAKAMRELSLRPVAGPGAPLVDTCGTGGDGSGSLNLSTATALLSSACGLRVVKHGNRSITSKSGSADVLEKLGVPLPENPTQTMELLERTGFTFLFAPFFHPAMAAIMPVRRALGIRTVFNVLGPLVNPARPPFQLVGAYDLDVARRMSVALSGLEIQRAFVIHGAEGWDEATPIGPFTLLDVTPGQVTETERDPRELGFAPCSATDLAGGDPAHNAARLRAVLTGADRGPHRDAVVLSTALVLEVTGQVQDIRQGVEQAQQAIDTGAGSDLLHKLTGASSG